MKNKSAILDELKAWEQVQKAMVSKLDALYDLVGCQPENPLPTAVYTLLDAHTGAVARLVGDEFGFMEWWVRECDYGNRPMSAGRGDKMQPIKTLKQLAALIAE